MLLLLLLAVVSVEINQKENVHLPLGFVLSVRRPGVGRVSLTCLGGLRRKCCVAVVVGVKSAMSGSVVVTGRRTTVVFLPCAEIFQEETAFSVSRASRALSKAVGNPATG